MLDSIINNLAQNLLNPLLLFFFAGFLIPILRVEFEFPKALFQSLTIVLLLSIGWHGGEQLAELEAGSDLLYAALFIGVGFLTNLIIGMIAYGMLRSMTKLRKIDASTIAGYYGSDSAGTFVTALGFLTALNIKSAPYMPVMVAVMEIPGCLLALILVANLRKNGMDANGNTPGELNYVSPEAPASVDIPAMDTSLVAEDKNLQMRVKKKMIDGHLLHEVFLNPGTFLLFAGVAIGLLASLKGGKATEQVDHLFNFQFQAMLCLFLMEMGTTACRRAKDLKVAGPGFIFFALAGPNIFAMFGFLMAYLFSMTTGYPLEIGTYVLFMVLCGSSSLIAVPAVQRMAIPEASPTLPLAASLGLTFTFMVTVGIPMYLEIVKILLKVS
ncbi:MAG: sodium-dependent bicarbonate transport family permease [bacterium]